MADKSEIPCLLPRIAELRRGAVNARRLARRSNGPPEIESLTAHAEALDREADAVEAWLAILKAATRVSDEEELRRSRHFGT